MRETSTGHVAENADQCRVGSIQARNEGGVRRT